VLHVVAALAGLFAVTAIARGSFTRVDFWLACFPRLERAVGALRHEPLARFSALLAISASGVLVFWTARAPLREAGPWPVRSSAPWHWPWPSRRLTALFCRAYGLETHFFRRQRAFPGGTLGKPQLSSPIAAAFGLPLLLIAAITAGQPPQCVSWGPSA